VLALLRRSVCHVSTELFFSRLTPEPYATE